MKQTILKNAYNDFLIIARPYLNISNEEEYNAGLLAMEHILETKTDTLDDPFNTLVDLLAKAIDAYEMQDEELVKFIEESESLNVDIRDLRGKLKGEGNLDAMR